MTAVTWNPADKNSGITLSNGDLTATQGSQAHRALRATQAYGSGKRYFEILAETQGGVILRTGVANASASLSAGLGANADGWAYNKDGKIWHNNASSSYGNTYGSFAGNPAVISIAVDLDAGKIWFGIDGAWQGGGDPAAGTNAAYSNLTGILYPAASFWTQNQYGAARFKSADFTYTPPSGFSAWEGAGATTKAVVLDLVDRDSVAQANLTNLKWAFFDQSTPDALAAPVDKGAVETTDGAGEIIIEIPNSTLTSGQTGFLIISDTGGDAAVDSKAFAAPVVVSLI